MESASLVSQKKLLLQSLERLLNQHPGQPFILCQLGQPASNRLPRLIERYNNIYFHTGWTNPVALKNSNQPWVNVFYGQRLAPEWRELFTLSPERFVFALDNVFAEHWSSLYVKQMEYWQKALTELPPQAAHLIAHGNAERLWHISPRK